MTFKKIIEDGPPPYDSLCLCRGKHKEYGFWRYCLAYNQCYRPEMNMCQVLELEEEDLKKIPILNNVPFEVEEYMELEQ